MPSVGACYEAELQWGRGCVATEIGDLDSQVIHVVRASMGPWLCSHGNHDMLCAAASIEAELQWGRGCVATEMRGTGFRLGLAPSASMGPWLCSHGNLEERAIAEGWTPASMGPWLCSHGN